MRLHYLFFTLILLLLRCDAYATNVVVTVGSNGNNFNPAAFTVQPGDTVTWVWSAGHHNTSALTLPAGALPWYANITGTDTIFRYIPSVSGLYHYTCTHHSGMDGQFLVTGCSYPEKPVITPGTVPGLCPGDTVLLSTAQQAGATYQWLNNVTLIPGGNTATLAVTTSGLYKVLVSRCGVDSASGITAVAVNPLPPASFTGNNTGLSYIFTNGLASHGPYTFRWIFSDGSPSQTTLHATHTFPSAGIYTVTLYVTDTTTGCLNTAAMVLPATLSIPLPGRNSYALFPNPATSILQIQITRQAKLVLTNIAGQALPVQIHSNANGYYMDMGRIPSGLYLLRISTDKAVTVEKIIVTH